MKEQDSRNPDADHEAVSRCQMGDVDAFEEIVMKYQKRMFNISYRMLGDYNEAAEAVQDAFVSVFRNIKGFRGESGLFTWISAIVVNMSRNRLRQMRKRAFREELSVDDPVDTDCGQIIKEPVSDDLSVLDKLEKREMQQKVEGCINGLDSEFREVIVLRDIQGFSYEEISDMLNIAVGTVKSRLHRARIAVKNCLRKFIGEL